MWYTILMYILILERLFLDAMVDIVYFPIWWYTKGLVFFANKVLNLFRAGNENLAPGVWLKNIFVPMYGQYDWQGRLISFLVRLVQIIFRVIALLVWVLICLVILAVWFVFPLLVTQGLLMSLLKPV